MLELVLLLVLLVGVPILAIAVVTGSAAYLRAGAAHELAAMAEEDERTTTVIDGDDDQSGGDPDERDPSDSTEP